MFVFRLPSLKIDPDVLEKECQELRQTRYKKTAMREEAPEKADCLTGVDYVFQRAVQRELPLVWIGNMPRLLQKEGWEVRRIAKEELKPGDLVFLGKGKKTVSHLALAIGEGRVFHVCWTAKGGVIEDADAVLKKYSQPEEKEMLSYVDPRSSL